MSNEVEVMNDEHWNGFEMVQGPDPNRIIKKSLLESAKTIERQTSRRLKYYMVGADTILAMVAIGFNKLPDYIYRFNSENIPDDCVILTVNYEPWYQMFGILLQHPSFDEVAEGDVIPKVPAKGFQLEWVPLKLKSE